MGVREVGVLIPKGIRFFSSPSLQDHPASSPMMDTGALYRELERLGGQRQFTFVYVLDFKRGIFVLHVEVTCPP
jgi:hypothetical protein